MKPTHVSDKNYKNFNYLIFKIMRTFADISVLIVSLYCVTVLVKYTLGSIGIILKDKDAKKILLNAGIIIAGIVITALVVFTDKFSAVQELVASL